MKMNYKCVAEYIKRKAAWPSKNVVDFAGSLVRMTASISHESLQPGGRFKNVYDLNSESS